MLVNPTLEEVVNGPRGMKIGIKKCLDSQCLVSAVTLMYSSIDSLAALLRPNPQQDTNKKFFIEWSDKFILPYLNGYELNSLDLFASRCSLVHKYSMDSRLSLSGEAKRIVYVWDDQPFVDISLKNGDQLMSVNDLHRAYVSGTADFLEFIAMSDKDIQNQIEENIDGMFCYRPWGNGNVLVA